MDTYNLDETDPAAPEHDPPGAPRRRRWWPAAVVVVLLVVAAAVVIGADQRSRDREFAALLTQVTRSQSSVTYSQGQIQAMVRYTSPLLTSASAPERVRAGLRALIQEVAADRVAPLQARRAGVADLPVARRHGEIRRARDAYLAHLDERIAFVEAVATDGRALYRPRPQAQRLEAAARTSLLAASPDPGSGARIRSLLP